MKSLELENYGAAPDTPSHALGGLPVLHDYIRRLASLTRVYLELRLPVEAACLAARADLESDFAKSSRI